MKTALELARARFPKVIPEPIVFGGGIDVATPPLLVRPSMVRSAQNYECDLNGGYARIAGYERFDGHAKPSDARYAVITATITGVIAVGNTITGGTSAATGIVVGVTASYVALTKVTGTFVSGENLRVGGITQAVSTTAAIFDGAPTQKLHAQYKKAAADVYRTDILAVPGSGNILGVCRYNDTTYAWRNNAGGTAAAIYKSSASGWQAVTLYYELAFTAASGTAPAEGATITKGAVSALLKRLVLESGTFAGGTAAGRLIIAAPSGGSFSAGAFTGGIVGTCSGAEAQITLQPGGRYEFSIDNFGGSVNTKRIYGADGANRGFEFDGDVFVPIKTGMTTDTPLHVAVHRNYLVFSFKGSIQFSGPGLPYQWSPIVGAGEIALGEDVTALAPQPGSEAFGAMAITARSRISVLYGTTSANFTLIPYKQDGGAFAYSHQFTGYSVFLDDFGITTLATTQSFGNFQDETVSRRLKPWLNTQRIKTTASCIVRNKNQYRLFFSDGYAVYMTLEGRKVVGLMPVLFPNPVRCAHSAKDSDGSEAIFFGSSNGMVYQMERGPNFDGATIDHFLWLHFNHSRSPMIEKHYRNCMLEVTGSGYCEFTFSYQLGYGASDVPQPGDQAVVQSFASVFWDSFTWDAFTWDGATLTPAYADMDGDGVNMSIMIRGSADYQESFRFSGAIANYSPRRLMGGGH